MSSVGSVFIVNIVAVKAIVAGEREPGPSLLPSALAGAAMCAAVRAGEPSTGWKLPELEPAQEQELVAVR